ncbi:adenylate/guanylate cyclase domain-containing protein [Ferrimonas sediminicola]|uniref:Adenylate/guanylate cyclase domain-containing protein n=2 Tax=Ferrimonas sediminicola TaxID=2569538 RepID=A0A4U1BDZ5_9GAMM|nr:adenylate/guanylate cyclase domain-containing protein [Ferrimonas sediminicola]
MQSRQQFLKLVFAIIAWSLAMMAYVTFRYAQGDDRPYWAITAADLTTLSIYMGLIFGCLHWLSNLITDVSGIRRMPYAFIVAFKGLFLLLGALTLAYITNWLNSWDNAEQFAATSQILTAHVLNAPSAQTLIAYLVLVRTGLAFIEQMGLLVGPRVLLNIGMGKYHKPRYEERIFLFLDMVSSTAHAEALGDYRFSRLIQDCFDLLSDVVTQNQGEIYRYVGDAVLISWPQRHRSRARLCLNVYFDFVQTLYWNRHYFQKEYGFVPKFKAAAHGGQVVAALVGVYKQEISFFSDVLNTLARLQDQCGPLGCQMLISHQVKDALDGEHNYDLLSLGPVRLKGKQQEIEVFSVSRTYSAADPQSSPQEF